VDYGGANGAWLADDQRTVATMMRALCAGGLERARQAKKTSVAKSAYPSWDDVEKFRFPSGGGQASRYDESVASKTRRD